MHAHVAPKLLFLPLVGLHACASARARQTSSTAVAFAQHRLTRRRRRAARTAAGRKLGDLQAAVTDLALQDKVVSQCSAVTTHRVLENFFAAGGTVHSWCFAVFELVAARDAQAVHVLEQRARATETHLRARDCQPK